MVQSNASKILVTGANGQLANEIRERSKDFPEFEFHFFSREELPIDNEEILQHTFASHQFQFCINCAAYTAVDRAESEKDLAFSVNATGVGYLAGLCKKYGVKFIHISTDYVYDDSIQLPLKEDGAVAPKNVYGESKLKGEKIAMDLNPESIIIRTSWVFSAYGNNFVKTMFRLFSQRPELNVVSDQLGCPTYAADLAEVILIMIRQMASGKTFRGIYNYSNEGETNWFEFASAIKELDRSECVLHPIPTTAYPTPAARPFYSVMDTTKIKHEMNITIPHWRDALSRCMKILRS